jgi:hypothetical protein
VAAARTLRSSLRSSVDLDSRGARARPPWAGLCGGPSGPVRHSTGAANANPL